MARETMRTLSDVPLPPPPRTDAAPSSGSEVLPRPSLPPLPRSDVAPRSFHTVAALPRDPRLPQTDADDPDALFPPGAFSPDDAIDQQIADLERWAAANERRERAETVRFWVLRGAAFTCAVLASIGGSFGYGRAAAVLAAVAAVVVAIDAAWPGASLRNPYRRAVCDLRSLQNTIKIKWDKVRLAHPNPTGARRVANALAVLDGIQAKREIIGRYLGSAEPSRGIKRQ